MLPPVLEIYVVWHPDDPAGERIAQELLEHFHGNRYTGLIDGAVEVFVRSEGWRFPGDVPRPIPTASQPPPHGLSLARLTVIAPIMGLELARAVQSGHGSWYEYAESLVAAHLEAPGRCTIIPVIADRAALDGTLGSLVGRFKHVGSRKGGQQAQDEREQRCRELTQAVARFAGGIAPERPMTVFISHTNRAAPGDEGSVLDLIQLVRTTIRQTHLDEFFAPWDLQPGKDWSQELRANAGNAALLALRTDFYASRAWCQREMLIAKRAGMPVVVLDALGDGEERGSFLMDHVPKVPVRQLSDGWRPDDVRRGLNVLIDECLQRVLWRHQHELASDEPGLSVTWWAPYAPEPTTFADWLASNRSGARTGPMRVLHPDPPLGPDEVAVLQQLAWLSGVDPAPEFLTPRSFAARGG